MHSFSLGSFGASMTLAERAPVVCEYSFRNRGAGSENTCSEYRPCSRLKVLSVYTCLRSLNIYALSVVCKVREVIDTNTVRDKTKTAYLARADPVGHSTAFEGLNTTHSTLNAWT